MGDIIFARPRHEYESYRDFWTLAKLAGFPVIFIDEVDPNDNSKTYIVSSPDASIEWPMAYPSSRARIIYWMLEWYTDYVRPDGIDEVWHIDYTFAQKIGAKFVPIGSHPALGDPNKNGGLKYDVSHLMYLTGRRAQIVNEIKRHGLKVAPGGWGDVRNDELKRSKLMLHVHQHDNIPALAPLRVAIAAAYQLPVISEDFWTWPHIPNGMIHQAPFEKLPKLVLSYCSHPTSGRGTKALHHRLCYEFEFGRVVRAAV